VESLKEVQSLKGAEPLKEVVSLKRVMFSKRMLMMNYSKPGESLVGDFWRLGSEREEVFWKVEDWWEFPG